MKPIQIISQDVFDKVRSRFSNLEMGDENGTVTIDPAEARFFDFDFVLEGTNLGRVSISLNDLGSLKVYYSQGITENQDDLAKKEWYSFLKEMRRFAMRRLLRFDTRDIAKTNLDKNDFQHLAQTQGPKEDDMTTMNESRWNQKSTKKTSRAVKGQTEVIVRHARPVDEEYAGSRSQRKNIKAIFIQNKDGERFKYPFIHTAGAFAMAQHVDHGGVPHDAAGKAIIRMSEEIAKLGQFKNTIRTASLHDDAMGIAERAIGRLNELKAQVEALGKRHNYESWMSEFVDQNSDEGLMELDPVTMEDYKSKFTQTNFQEELSGYFPLLHRIMSETNKIDLEDYVGEGEDPNMTKAYYMGRDAFKLHGDNPTAQSALKTIPQQYKEMWIKGFTDARDLPDDRAKEGTFEAFENWAEAVEQGKLTNDQIESLKQALQQQEQAGRALELGPNGSTAWDFFQGAINSDDASMGPEFSDDLKHKLEVAAQEFPDTDAMEVFQSWAKEDYPELLVALGMSGQEEPQQTQQPEEEPAAENDEMSGNPNEAMPKEGSQKEMIKMIAEKVKSFYNRDNPEVGPFRGEENIATDICKEVADKFGESAGEQAREMATAFMEKLSKDWEQRHGKVGNDGLARLKELVGNIKGKVESIGDVGGHPGKNIMPAEGEMDEADQKGVPAKNTDVSDKAWLKDIGKSTKPGPLHNVGKGLKAFVQGKPEPMGESDELSAIRKLSGLAK